MTPVGEGVGRTENSNRGPGGDPEISKSKKLPTTPKLEGQMQEYLVPYGDILRWISRVIHFPS